MSVWLDSSGNSNKFKQSYFRDFVDVSGEVLIRNGLSLKLYNNNVPTRVQFSINSNEFRIYNETDHTYYDISNTKLIYLQDLSENVQAKLNQVNTFQSTLNLKANASVVDASFVSVNSLIATKASTSVVDASFTLVNSEIATKASTSVVDASLNLKSDIAYLDASLNAKPSFSQVDASMNLKANLSSPTFTGTPNAPTASYDNSSNQLATTGFVQGRISSIINSAPAALDTLNELAAALGNDANYASTVTNALSQKANTADVNTELALRATITSVDASLNLKSNLTYVDASLNAKPSFSQVDASLNLKSAVTYVDLSLNLKPSFSQVDASLNLKSDILSVDASLNLKANLVSPTFTGTPNAPTASYDNSSNQLATTGFVQGRISSIINGAPAALDTLYELAAALGNDANYASTVTTALSQKANAADVNAELALKATITSVDASLNLKSNVTYVDASLNAKPNFSQVDASLNLKSNLMYVDASLNLKSSLAYVDTSLNLKSNVTYVDASLNAKPNFSQVDASLNVKSDITYVDASLNLKSSLAYVDTSLNLKSSIAYVDTSLNLKSNVVSPTFTGTPNAPTASYDNSSNQIATTGFVQGRINSIINSAPAALDTLNELAAALGNDANYAATVTNALSQKANATDVNSALALKATIVTVDASLNLKSNVTYVDASLNAKPSFSQVDASLNLKSDITSVETSLNLKANLVSPTFTGTPNAPTATYDNSSNQLATTGFVQGRISSIINSAPAALDTLNELAAALGNDANYAATITNSLSQKANTTDVNSALALKATTTSVDASLNTKPSFSQVDASLNTKPSFSQVDASLNLKSAVTYVDASLNLKPSFSQVDAYLSSKSDIIYVDASLNLKATLASPTFTGTPNAPTASYDNSSNQLATTGFVQGRISSIINSAPAALDTLNELAAALGNDANYAATVTNSLSQKANATDVNASLNLKSNVTYVDASLNAKPSFSQVDISLNAKPSFSQVDASLNLKSDRTYVDASLNAKPSFSQVDASLNLKSDRTYVDLSLNAKPSFSQVDASMNLKADLASPVFTGIVTAPKLTSGDASFNGNVDISGVLSVTQTVNSVVKNTTINNYNVSVTNDLSLNGKLIVSSDVSLNSKLYVKGDASFNGRVDICGNFYAQYPNNSIPSSAISNGVTFSYVDSSLNMKPSFAQVDASLNAIVNFSQIDASLNLKSNVTYVDASLNLKSAVTYVDASLNLKSAVTYVDASLNLKANLASPTFTGTPNAPTATYDNSSNQIATTGFVQGRISSIINSAPAALDTLNELAAALGNDANYAATVTNSLSQKANITDVNSSLTLKPSFSQVDASLNLKPSFAQVDASLNAIINASQIDASLNLKPSFSQVDASLNLKSNVTYVDLSLNLKPSFSQVDASLNLKANIASPTFIGTPNAPTASYDNSSNQIATTGFVQGRISSIINSAPAALDTLNELAAALGNDANYAATVTNSLSQKANITDVNSALALKPSFSQVDASLNLKAAVTYVDSSLNLKPTFSQVDASLNLKAAVTYVDSSLNLKPNFAQVDASLNLKPTFAQVDASLNAILNLSQVDASLNLKANLASPTFTGTPNAPTASYDNSSNQIATTGFVQGRISSIINSAPAALDTLNELAAALGNDANYAATVTNSLSQKANIIDVNSALALKPSFTQVDVSLNLRSAVTYVDASLNLKPSFSQVDASLNLKPSFSQVDASLNLKPSFSQVDASLNLKPSFSQVDASLNLKPSFSQVDASLNLKPTFAQVDVSLNLKPSFAQVDASLNLKSAVTYVDASLNLKPTFAQVDASLNVKAALASPALTGVPTAPTATAGTNTTQIATTAFVKSAVDNLVASAPAALDTLNELAAALGNDAAFSTTVTNTLALKAPLANPTFTGTVSASKVTISSDASFNGRVDICGNFYANYPANSIPSSAIIGGVSGGSTSGVDISSNQTISGVKTFTNGLNVGNTLVSAILGPDPNYQRVQIGQDIDGEAAGDQSGYSVSMNSDGTIVAIGAIWNDGTASNAGHVRVYKYSGSTWAQLGQDIEGATDINAYFGQSVSLSSDGTTVAVGAPGNNTNTGRVRVYKYNGTTWAQIGDTKSGYASNNQCGFSVSLNSNGTVLVISIPFYSPANGETVVYKYDGTIWSQISTSVMWGEAAGDQAGYSVSINSDGTIVAIGANLNDGTGSNAGHVRVYKYNGTGVSWTKLGQDIDGEAAGDNSGYSVSLSADGTIVAIGAPSNIGTSGVDRGHVRVYKYNGSTTWTKLGQDIDGEAAGDKSGTSVSLSSDGTVLAVGAPNNSGNGTNSGQVRIYQYSNSTSTWTQLGSDIDGEAANNYSGWSVSLSTDGNFVAIGAYNNSGVTGASSGHVRVYKIRDTTTTKLTVSNNLDICGNLYAQYAAASIPASAINGISTAIQTAIDLKATKTIVDASFTTVNSAIALKADLASPALTGVPTAPTATSGTNTTQLATTAFVTTAVSTKADLASPTFTGNVVASKMRVTSDASFNGRVDICGNFYAQYPASSIPSSAIIGGVGGGGGGGSSATDISINSLTVGRGGGNNICNTVLGVSAGAALPVDSANNSTAIGAYALSVNNVVGGNNTAIGFNALKSHTGGFCTAVGSAALQNNTSGYMNVAVGVGPLQSNTTGSYNVAMNWGALIANNIGNDNIAIGKQALTTNQSGSNNIGIGTLAMQGTTSSSNNTAVGYRSLVYSSTGNSNTAYGYLAGQNNSSGSFNTYIGYGTDVPTYGPTWSNSTAIGANAMITASNQITLGTAAERVFIPGKLSTSGDASFNGRVDISGSFYVNSLTVGRGSGNNSSNTALGVNALFAQGVDVNSNSTAIGYYALSANQAGNAVNNSAVGFEALKNNTTGNFNTALGSAALRNNTTGGSNTALGASSLTANTTGNSNVGINGGLSANTTGSDNIAIGKQTLTSSQTGGNNIGIGTLVLQGITSSSNNTAIGHRALVYSSTGTSNTAYGYLAGGNNSTGSFNTYIGYGADVPAFGATWSNSTAIGANAMITASNQITLGTAAERVFMPGKLTTSGDASFNGRLDVGTNSLTPFATLAVAQIGTNLLGRATARSVGTSTAVNDAGTIVALGCPSDGNFIGSVRIYQWSGTAWTQLGQDIVGTADNTQLGSAVSLSSTGFTIAIGGFQRDLVRVYQYASNVWTQVGADIIGTGQAGSSVSLSADGLTVAIGAPHAYINGGQDTGQTRVYKYISSAWTQLGQDLIGEAASNWSGCSVALSADGTTVVIGANYNNGVINGTTAYMSGHARIYKYANSTWTQLGQDIDGEVAYDMSGWSVAISDDGTIVAIGAPRNTTGATTYNGQVRVYKYANSTWTKLGQDIDGRAIWAQSGSTVSLSANGYTVAIGADSATGLGGESNQGYACVYTYNGTTWSMVGSYIEGQAANDKFGTSMSLSSDGTILSVGSPYNNSSTGYVKVYKVQTPSSKIIVSDGIDICGNLYAKTLQLSSSATFNGRVDICGNFYAQYPPNSIPASAIIGGVGSSVSSSGSSGSSTGANVTFTDSFALIKEAVVVDPASILLRQF